MASVSTSLVVTMGTVRLSSAGGVTTVSSTSVLSTVVTSSQAIDIVKNSGNCLNPILASPLICLDYSNSFGAMAAAASCGTSTSSFDSDESSESEDEVDDDKKMDEDCKDQNTKSDEEEEDWLYFCSTSPSNASPRKSQLLQGRVLLGERYQKENAVKNEFIGSPSISMECSASGFSQFSASSSWMDIDMIDLGNSCSPKKRRMSTNDKKVHFDEESLVEILEFEDDLESRKMRETYWEVFARDRARFNDRINQTSAVLLPILNEEHRKNFFKQFIQPIVSKDTATAVSLQAALLKIF